MPKRSQHSTEENLQSGNSFGPMPISPEAGDAEGKPQTCQDECLQEMFKKGGKMIESDHNRSLPGSHMERRPPIISLSSERICHSFTRLLLSTVTFHQ